MCSRGSSSSPPLFLSPCQLKNFKRLVLAQMESYRDGEHQNVYRISSSILLWGVLGVKNDKKTPKNNENMFSPLFLLLYFSAPIEPPGAVWDPLIGSGACLKARQHGASIEKSGRPARHRRDPHPGQPCRSHVLAG